MKIKYLRDRITDEYLIKYIAEKLDVVINMQKIDCSNLVNSYTSLGKIIIKIKVLEDINSKIKRYFDSWFTRIEEVDSLLKLSLEEKDLTEQIIFCYMKEYQDGRTKKL